MKRPVWWYRSLWFLVYSRGGSDGYRTIGGRRLPGGSLSTARQHPEMRDEIRHLAVIGRKRKT